MPIFSSTTGWVKPRINRGARNAHLLPEINTRLNRIITGARAEQTVANQVLQDYVELWHPLTNGRPCTCTAEVQKQSIEKTVEKHEGIRLEDFLITNNAEIYSTREFCPLCFNTGIVGGYRRSGCEAIILDAGLRNKTRNVTLMQEKPWWFMAGPTKGTVTWKVEIPQYFNDAIDIVIRWHNRPPSEWSLMANGETLTLDLLKSLAGETVDIQLTMQDISSVDDNVGLVAIWLQLEIANALVPVEFPNLQENFTGALNVYGEYSGPITINFDGGSQGIITPNDIAVHHSNSEWADGGVWRIIQVEQDTVLSMNVDYACEARLVRAFENYFLIPSKIIRQRYRCNEYTFVE